MRRAPESMPVVIESAAPEHLAEISALAGIIWRAHYPGIISPAQIDYMLAHMYDVDVMRRELETGIAWFRALADGALRGFASVGPGTSASEFKLHKLYVHPDWQRYGLGSALLKQVEDTAQQQGAKTLVLSVNKRNAIAIAAYRQRGFTIRESVVVEIGSGFVMDDYVMSKSIL